MFVQNMNEAIRLLDENTLLCTTLSFRINEGLPSVMMTWYRESDGNLLQFEQELRYVEEWNQFHVSIPHNEFAVWSEYLNHPEKPFLNLQGYCHSQVHEYVNYYDDSASRLMMYHGMADDNVLFQHSTEIYKLLIDSGKLFNTIDYPGQSRVCL